MSLRQLNLICGDIAKEKQRAVNAPQAPKDISRILPKEIPPFRATFENKVLLTIDLVVGVCVAGGFAAVTYFTVR